MSVVTIKVVSRYTCRPCSTQTCEQFEKPYGTWEIFDHDGFRLTFAKNEQAAIDEIADFAYGDLGHMDFELIKEKNDVSD